MLSTVLAIRDCTAHLSTLGASWEALPPFCICTRYIVKCAPLAGVMRCAVRLLVLLCSVDLTHNAQRMIVREVGQQQQHGRVREDVGWLR